MSGYRAGGVSCVVPPVATGRKGTFPIACSINVGFGVGLAEWGSKSIPLSGLIRCQFKARIEPSVPIGLRGARPCVFGLAFLSLALGTLPPRALVTNLSMRLRAFHTALVAAADLREPVSAERTGRKRRDDGISLGRQHMKDGWLVPREEPQAQAVEGRDAIAGGAGCGDRSLSEPARSRARD